MLVDLEPSEPSVVLRGEGVAGLDDLEAPTSQSYQPTVD
jgi:hypothetical protein